MSADSIGKLVYLLLPSNLKAPATKIVNALLGKTTFTSSSATLVVTTEEEVAKRTFAITQIFQKGLTVVSHQYLLDCEKNNARLDFDGYLLSEAPAPKSLYTFEYDTLSAEVGLMSRASSTSEHFQKLLEQSNRAEPEETKSAPSSSFESKNASRTGRKPLEAHTGPYPSVRVSKEGTFDFPDDFFVEYYCAMQWTDIVANHNKYYCIEMHTATNKGDEQIRIYTHYGRTDDLAKKPTSGVRESRFYDTFEEAENAYLAIVNEKSIKKGYRKVDLVQSNIGSHKLKALLEEQSNQQATNNAALSDQKIDESELASLKDLQGSVKELVQYIYEEATMSLSKSIGATKITAQGIATPLGVIQMKQILQGEALLDQILEIVKAGDAQSKRTYLTELSGMFYTIIPSDFGGRSRNAVESAMINTLQAIEEKQELLQLMKDMLQVASESAGSHQLSEIDLKYFALHCKITELDHSSSEFKEVCDAIQHSEIGPQEVVVDKIFALHRNKEYEAFQNNKIHEINPRLLYHGSRISNFVGLLSRGVLMPKMVVSMGGKRRDAGLLGHGIYFGDSVTTSARYTLPGRNGARMMLLNQVALGNVRDYTQVMFGLTEPPQGFHSVHGVRATEVTKSDFVDDEYVIFDTTQQHVKYLLQFHLKSDMPNKNNITLGMSTEIFPDYEEKKRIQEEALKYESTAIPEEPKTQKRTLTSSWRPQAKPPTLSFLKKKEPQPEEGSPVEPTQVDEKPSTFLRKSALTKSLLQPSILEVRARTSTSSNNQVKVSPKKVKQQQMSLTGQVSQSNLGQSKKTDAFNLKLQSNVLKSFKPEPTDLTISGNYASTLSASKLSTSGLTTSTLSTSGASNYSVSNLSISNESNLSVSEMGATFDKKRHVDSQETVQFSHKKLRLTDSGVYKSLLIPSQPITGTSGSSAVSSSDPNIMYKKVLYGPNLVASKMTNILGKDNWTIKKNEDKLRDHFVNDRTNFLLSDSALNQQVTDIFKKRELFKQSALEKDIPVILAQAELEYASIYATVNLEAFTAHFTAATSNVLKGLNWSNVVAAGGLVMSCLLNTKKRNSDMDDLELFLYDLNEESAKQKMKEIFATIQSNTKGACEMVRTRDYVTILAQYPVHHTRIVLRVFKHPAEVLCFTDMDCCCFYYTGTTVFTSERGRRALTKRCNFVDLQKRSLAYETALYKFAKRGFSVAVPGLQRYLVQPTLINKSPDNVSGLARLLVLDQRLKSEPVLKPNGKGLYEMREPWKPKKLLYPVYSRNIFSDDKIAEYELLRTFLDTSCFYIPWGPEWSVAKVVEHLQAYNKNAKPSTSDLLVLFGLKSVTEAKTTTQIDYIEPFVSPELLCWRKEAPDHHFIATTHRTSEMEWYKGAYASDTQTELTNHLCNYTWTANIEQLKNILRKIKASGVSQVCVIEKRTALIYACFESNLELVRNLLGRGAKAATRDEVTGFFPLHIACLMNDTELVELLLRNGADLNAKTKDQKWTALHVCAYLGYTHLVDTLLNHSGLKLNLVDRLGRTPLFLAAMQGHLPCLELLRLQGAKITLASSHNVTPLAVAAESGHKECCDFIQGIVREPFPPAVAALPATPSLYPGVELLANTTNIAMVDEHHHILLHYAVTHYDLHLVSFLLDSSVTEIDTSKLAVTQESLHGQNALYYCQYLLSHWTRPVFTTPKKVTFAEPVKVTQVESSTDDTTPPTTPPKEKPTPPPGTTERDLLGVPKARDYEALKQIKQLLSEHVTQNDLSYLPLLPTTNPKLLQVAATLSKMAHARFLSKEAEAKSLAEKYAMDDEKIRQYNLGTKKQLSSLSGYSNEYDVNNAGGGSKGTGRFQTQAEKTSPKKSLAPTTPTLSPSTSNLGLDAFRDSMVPTTPSNKRTSSSIRAHSPVGKSYSPPESPSAPFVFPTHKGKDMVAERAKQSPVAGMLVEVNSLVNSNAPGIGPHHASVLIQRTLNQDATLMQIFQAYKLEKDWLEFLGNVTAYLSLL